VRRPSGGSGSGRPELCRSMGELEALGWTSTSMTLTEQVAQLRELARLSSGTRMLDVLIINVLDEVAQAVGRLERNEPPGPDKV
jgi:hypothetical protein